MFTKEQLNKCIDEAEAIVIGAGAGLSAAAGFEYGGSTFMDNFQYMHDQYGYEDMYSAGFHFFASEEEKWGYWSKMIDLNRYKKGALPLYKRLLEMVKNKNYFVITTNVDHQFQLAGFRKERLFYMQGDYGLLQCPEPCHNQTYDNEKEIHLMLQHIVDHKVPSSLLPRCPRCGKIMTMNLRCDEHFVQDKGWYQARDRYTDFMAKSRHKKVLYLELGVGFSTPGWIKYPFMEAVSKNPKATYVVIDKGYIWVPNAIQRQTIVFHDDINQWI